MRKNILIKNALLVLLITIILAITALSVNSAFVKPQGKDCITCHKKHYEGTTNPNHIANNFPTKCDTCHRAASGAWRPATAFNHTGITSGCYECHKAKYDSTTNPNHASSGFPTTCEQCHKSTNSWKPASFSHANFPLTGKHIGVECSKCHLNNQYLGTPKECYACHWTRKQTDPWKLQLGQTCNNCHNTSNWKPANWSHSSPPASWSLTGSHITTTCLTCHPNYEAASAQKECYSCHKAKYDSTTNPNHVSSGFPTTCEQCHGTAAWKPATFSHTKYPLTGKHIGVECSKCHLNNQYVGTPNECYSCHWTRKQTDPWKLQLGQTCNNCHNTSNWKPASWSHSSPPASWSLTGKHITLSCLTCHPNYEAASAQKECYSCHKAKYDSTTNPNHAASGFPTTCEQCHSTTAWKPATFSHTKYPLTGKHIGLECSKCHLNNQYQGTPNDCYSCHWIRNQRDPWKLQLGQTCNQCHNTSNWKPASWSHSSPPASWSLTGLHITLSCLTCHPNYNAASAQKECYSCHKAKYDSTTNPNHAASGFPTTCEQCHSTTAWKPATFSHTKYPLTGKHFGLECSKCHLNNQYQGTPNDCYSCHWIRNQRDPWKLQLGQTCNQCHNTSNWKPASWSHSSPPASWSLTGKHLAASCLTCHPNYNATSTQKECYSCHKPQYDASANPKHSTIGFGTICEQCHNTTVWKPSSWSHSSPPASWPLTGKHATLGCTSCHPNSQQLTSKACYSCHKAKYDASTNPKHSAANISTVCENCHNTSAWTPAQFNHAVNAKGAISPKMANVKCNNCHPNNSNYTRSATKCLGCHQKEHHQDPCAQCHYTSGDWDNTR